MTSTSARRWFAALVATACGSFGLAMQVSAQATGRAAGTGDSAAVVAVVDGFHAALAKGDTTGALALLAPDVTILESGGIESREDYRAHHLGSDIEFAKAVPSTRGEMKVVVRGDVAWVTATSTTKGEMRGRPINSIGAELVVLSREAGGWRIRAIHWSSRRGTG